MRADRMVSRAAQDDGWALTAMEQADELLDHEQIQAAHELVRN